MPADEGQCSFLELECEDTTLLLARTMVEKRSGKGSTDKFKLRNMYKTCFEL